MQRPHRRDHVRGISALLPARLDQPVRRQLRQQRVQHRLLQPVPGDPAAELAQHAVIEPRISQPQPERVLPVQPGPHRLGRLPVSQLLAHLQHRHHRQPRRRLPRTAPHPERRRECLIGHPLPQPVPHRHRQRHPPARVLRPDRRRDHRIRLRPRHRTHRHHAPDSAAADGKNATAPAHWPAPRPRSRTNHSVSRINHQHQHWPQMPPRPPAKAAPEMGGGSAPRRDLPVDHPGRPGLHHRTHPVSHLNRSSPQ